MSNNACLWIRDGVLIERMHMNPGAFAYAYWAFANPKLRHEINFTALVQFGFDKSGYSCAEKIRCFNEEHINAVSDIAAASAYYNELAPRAGRNCRYFPGMIKLLEELKAAGVLHFITSAVEQTELDVWLKGTQARETLGIWSEVLGTTGTICKGEKHFEYVYTHYDQPKLILIGDATMEMRCGSQFSKEYNLTPVAFANVITLEKVREGMEMLARTVDELDGKDYPHLAPKPKLDPARLHLPNQEELTQTLKDAGAAAVVGGAPDSIIANLRQYFVKNALLT